MPKSRIAFFDNCKFFLMLLVVAGHFLDQATAQSPIYRSLFLFIYTFHMPAFFFLSGLFDSKRTPASKRLNRAAYYIALYLIMKVAVMLVRWPFTGEPSFTLLTEKGIPWFCLVLGVYTLLSGLWEKARVSLPAVLAISVILACAVGFDKGIGDFLCLSRMIVFYPFYLLGTIVSKEKLLRLLAVKWLRIVGAVILVGVLVICLLYVGRIYTLRKFFTGRNPYMDSIRPYGPLIRMACYWISAVTGLSFMLVIPRRSLGFLTTAGQRTMQVYFWHRPVLYVMAFLHLDSTVLSLGMAGKALWLLLAAALMLLLSLKLFGFPTKHLQQWMQRKEPSSDP